MSDQTDKRYQDRRLSDTYQALAKERAPEHLNERILGLAAGRTRYSRARAWTRPLAWAATIGLSLAIVLELNRLPSEVPDAIAVPAPDNALIGERQLETKESDAAQATSIVPASNSPAEGAIESRQKRPAAPKADRSDGAIKAEFVPQDAAILRDAEDMARAQSGSDQGSDDIRAESDARRADPDVAEEVAARRAAEVAGIADTSPADDVAVRARAGSASFTAMESTEDRLSAGICGESERNTPEAWLDCIRELESAGREDEARIEYEEFRRVFPDYDE